MVILGLTGSIGMGKSTAANLFRRLGIPVHDSDAAVHKLLGRGGAAVEAVETGFPGVVRDGAVDRQRLAERVFGDRVELGRLEAILHPKVRLATLGFLKRQARARRAVVVLDIPLLFETGGQHLCDAVVVVSAPAGVQASRVLARKGMTPERYKAILAKQLSDREKCRRADFVVQTGGSKRETLRRLAAIVRLMRGRTGRHWPPRRRLAARGKRAIQPLEKRHA
jgi:dephospho-CoA kinase